MGIFVVRSSDDLTERYFDCAVARCRGGGGVVGGSQRWSSRRCRRSCEALLNDESAHRVRLDNGIIKEQVRGS